MTEYKEDPNVDKNYSNLMVYVRFQTNIDKMDTYLKSIGIIPEIKYGNVYYLKRVYATTVVDIKSQNFIEKVFDLSVTNGQAPKSIKPDPEIKKNLNVYKNPIEKPSKSPKLPTTPPSPHIFTDIASENNLTNIKNKKN